MKPTVIFIKDFNEMIEVEKTLIEKLNYKWRHLSKGSFFLKNKFKDQIHMDPYEGIYVTLDPIEKTLSWSYGLYAKKSIEKTSHEILKAKDFLIQ